VGFDDRLAHQIEAGADLFVMPSHYEPCGLNQLYSLRYGTVPIVTATGGLADTVTNCTDSSLADRSATGFHLDPNQPQALDDAIGRALSLRYHHPDLWSQVVETGMAQDWSWRRSAEAYLSIYARSMTLRSQGKQSQTG
jgi:starch synthase